MNEQREIFTGTKATLQTPYGIFSIEVPERDLNIDDLWEEVLRPLLLGSGYSEIVADGLFGENK